MKIVSLIIGILCFFDTAMASEDITPYKFTDTEYEQGMPAYDIPDSSRFTVKRPENNTPDIIYYFTKPKEKSYPIAILCGGSTQSNSIYSIIHFHRYFLQEFLDIGAAVLTVEQWGVDGGNVDRKTFLDHYKPSQRLSDHETVIQYLKANPPAGWNGKLIWLGVSEGGPLVTSLTIDYPNETLATINWSGANDWSWRELIWVFIQGLLTENPECPHHVLLRDCSICTQDILSRENYDARMDAIAKNPSTNDYFLGMTYFYHADALKESSFDYAKIHTPMLVVAGVLDTQITSTDDFVNKAKSAGVNVTYFRVEAMDHSIRKRPDVIQKSFEWLQKLLLP